MRYFLSNHVPAFERVLLIESGSRHLYEDLLPGLYEIHGAGMRLDMITCFAGTPRNFRPEQGEIFRVGDYPTPERRKKLFQLLDERAYNVTGMICSNEPIMTKWKWALALRLKAKVFILNENGDYFWFDRAHAGIVRHFVLFRAGLTGAGAGPTFVRLVLFPFTLLYLLLYAATVHTRRKLRT